MLISFLSHSPALFHLISSLLYSSLPSWSPFFPTLLVSSNSSILSSLLLSSPPLSASPPSLLSWSLSFPTLIVSSLLISSLLASFLFYSPLLFYPRLFKSLLFFPRHFSSHLISSHLIFFFFFFWYLNIKSSLGVEWSDRITLSSSLFQNSLHNFFSSSYLRIKRMSRHMGNDVPSSRRNCW